MYKIASWKRKEKTRKKIKPVPQSIDAFPKKPQTPSSSSSSSRQSRSNRFSPRGHLRLRLRKVLPEHDSLRGWTRASRRSIILVQTCFILKSRHTRLRVMFRRKNRWICGVFWENIFDKFCYKFYSFKHLNLCKIWLKSKILQNLEKIFPKKHCTFTTL